MKIKEGFLLRTIAGQTVVLSATGDLELNKMITLNETGAFLWQLLQQETNEAAMTAALLVEYDVDEVTAAACVKSFVEKLGKHNFLA